MEFHPDKCQVLRVTNKRNTVDARYYIHSQEMVTVTNAKYLGVTLTKNLSWKQHIDRICAKAHNTRIFLQRNLVKSDKTTRIKCYKTFVRPIVEYASTVWDPVGNNQLVMKVESVQRKSLRWIFSSWKRDTSPTSMRQSLKLKTLEQRRETAKLKIFHELTHNIKHVTPDILPTRQRCANIKYKPILGRIKTYATSFFSDVVSKWNSLPFKVSNIEDFTKFKTELEKLYI